MAVVLDSVTGIVAIGECNRLFTERERLGMIARDGGCSFPGCAAPPSWCEAHHITERNITGRTSVDDGTLLCPWHHDNFEHLGWTCTTRNGRPQ